MKVWRFVASVVVIGLTVACGDDDAPGSDAGLDGSADAKIDADFQIVDGQVVVPDGAVPETRSNRELLRNLDQLRCDYHKQCTAFTDCRLGTLLEGPFHEVLVEEQAGRVAIDREELVSCVRVLESAVCVPYWRLRFFPSDVDGICDDIVRGQQALDEACGYDVACEHGLRCEGGGRGCEGTCQPAHLAHGEACSSGEACGYPYAGYCDPQTNQCAPLLQPGDECAGEHSQQCGPSSACYLRMCAHPGAEGTNCIADTDCDSRNCHERRCHPPQSSSDGGVADGGILAVGAQCEWTENDCPNGTSCYLRDERDVTRCHEPIPFGGSCIETAGCSPEDYCVSGVCEPRQRKGQQCNRPYRCEDDVRNQRYPEGWCNIGCLAPLHCLPLEGGGRVCADPLPPAQLGQTCAPGSGTNETPGCGDSLYCLDGTCVNKLGAGETCQQNSQCNKNDEGLLYCGYGDKCAPPPKKGERCNPYYLPCDDTEENPLRCEKNDGDSIGLCVGPPSRGENCEGWSGEYCQEEDVVCSRNNEAGELVCQDLRKEGDSCSSRATCSDGFVCTDVNGGVCAPVPSEIGDVCGPSLLCQGNLPCIDGVCVRAPEKEGDACDQTSGCPGELFCYDNACRAYAEDDETCYGAFGCKDVTKLCFEGSCTRRFDEGSECNQDNAYLCTGICVENRCSCS